MHEPDDRLAGDPVWEMFPDPSPPSRPRRLGSWLAAAALVAAAWAVSPPLAVFLACLAASLGEFRKGWRLRRAIPDRVGGGICSLFRHAWGAWRFGVAAFLLMFAVIFLPRGAGATKAPPPAFVAAAVLWLAGFVASAALTAAGLMKALRSGMRVWLGEGVNQARTLLLGMLLVGFTVAVLMPLCLLLAAYAPPPGGGQRGGAAMLLGIVACQFAAPVLILVLVDWFGHRILADRPGKFGPKVPTVGKWGGS